MRLLVVMGMMMVNGDGYDGGYGYDGAYGCVDDHDNCVDVDGDAPGQMLGSGKHFCVMWESRRENWGMLLPFIYLTYILRTLEEQEDPNTCRVVNILSDIMYGMEEEEMKDQEREEKKEQTGEQENRDEREGVSPAARSGHRVVQCPKAPVEDASD